MVDRKRVRHISILYKNWYILLLWAVDFWPLRSSKPNLHTWIRPDLGDCILLPPRLGALLFVTYYNPQFHLALVLSCSVMADSFRPLDCSPAGFSGQVSSSPPWGSPWPGSQAHGPAAPPRPAQALPVCTACKSAARNMPANLENSAVAPGLEKVSFHSNPKERQCQRMFQLPHNCTHLTC